LTHEFLDTTGELVDRIHGIPDGKDREDGYQGRLDPDVTDDATERTIGYLKDSLETSP
jgi:hypothetical protein